MVDGWIFHEIAQQIFARIGKLVSLLPTHTKQTADVQHKQTDHASLQDERADRQLLVTQLLNSCSILSPRSILKF